MIFYYQNSLVDFSHKGFHTFFFFINLFFKVFYKTLYSKYYKNMAIIII
jgi:hypothetical protein